MVAQRTVHKPSRSTKGILPGPKGSSTSPPKSAPNGLSIRYSPKSAPKGPSKFTPSKERPGIDRTGQVTIRSSAVNSIGQIVPLQKFELALDCAGSFLAHFTIEKNTECGRDGRELLMTILEPLLGGGLDFRALMGGINSYKQSRRYAERRYEEGDKVQQFLNKVTKDWKKK